MGRSSSVGRLVLAWLSVSVSGCFCLDLSGEGGTGGGGGRGGGGGGGASGPAVAADLAQLAEALADRCAGTVLQTYGVDPVTPASLTAAAAAVAAGGEDVALSPSGCLRLLVRREAGTVVREAVVGPPFNVQVVPYRASVTSFTYSAAGEVVESDEDADGLVERKSTLTLGQSVVHEQTRAGRRVVTTITPSPRGLRVVDEVTVDGETTRVEHFEPSKQPACDSAPIPPDETPGPPTPPTPCPAAQQMLLQDRLKQAAELGAGCLQALGQGARAAFIYREAVSPKTKLGCEDLGTGVAQNDTNYWLQTGAGKIVINPAQYFAGSVGEQTGKLAHEIMHFSGVHDGELSAAIDTIADAARRRRLWSLVDPITACEFVCFNPDADQCHLARCLGQTLPTRWMMAECPGTLDALAQSTVELFRENHVFPTTRPGMTTSGSLKSCNQALNVGAVCRERGPNGVGGTVKVCTTEAECRQSCSTSCESLSVSCLKSCR